MRRRALPRVAAVVIGAALPLLGTGVARADLPPLPLSSLSVSILYQPPGLGYAVVPPPPGTCQYEANFDNSATSPPGTIYRGLTACGAGVYNPLLTGQVVLLDPLGNVVSAGSGFAQVGGIGVSQGDYQLEGDSGPVPGLVYTIRYDTSITLNAPNYWGPPATGCSVNGQTLTCRHTVMYNYIPGTQGGLTPG